LNPDRHTYLKKCLGSASKAAADPTFVTLKGAMQALGHSHITLLKIDIEGGPAFMMQNHICRQASLIYLTHSEAVSRSGVDPLVPCTFHSPLHKSTLKTIPLPVARRLRVGRVCLLAARRPRPAAADIYGAPPRRWFPALLRHPLYECRLRLWQPAVARVPPVVGGFEPVHGAHDWNGVRCVALTLQ
jgi:hypothetical protein